MFYNPLQDKFVAMNCDLDNYGVANKTAGLSAFPCKQCPAGLQARQTLPNSAKYYATQGDKQGFTHPLACVTKKGHGYNGIKCAPGSYNDEGNYGDCKQCPMGMTTANDAALQVTEGDCVLDGGFGVYGGVKSECPVGELGLSCDAD